MSKQQTSSQKAIVGNPHGSFWLYDSEEGFDLTHPKTPTSRPVDNAILIETTRQSIKIDPSKSALVIIDMQNMFLSTSLGRPADSNGLKAQTQLLQYAIPAARKAGIRVIWLNWGITDEDLPNIPPAEFRAFGFETVDAADFDQYAKNKAEGVSDDDFLNQRSLEASGKNKRIYKGIGNDIGQVTLADGSVVEGGRLLMRNQWNTRLMPNLEEEYQEGLKCSPSDVWFNKVRMSGFWGKSTSCTEFLDREEIKTLFFAGVNTDQCVYGSLQDAFMKGYDCILLTDGSGTSSPDHARQCVEFNAANWGFCTSCRQLWQGVEDMRNTKQPEAEHD